MTLGILLWAPRIRAHQTLSGRTNGLVQEQLNTLFPRQLFKIEAKLKLYELGQVDNVRGDFATLSYLTPVPDETPSVDKM